MRLRTVFPCFLSIVLFNSGAHASYENIIALAKAGKLSQAYSQTQEKLKTNPKHPKYLLLAGKLSSDGKKSMGYYKTLEQLPKKFSEQEEALYRLAQAYYSQGQYGMAISYYRKVIRKYPNGNWKTLSHYWMGLSCLIYGKKNPAYLDSAEQHYTTLLTSTPDDKEYQSYALEGLVQVWLAQGKKQKAMDGLRMAFEEPSSYSLPTLYLQAIRLYRGKGRQQALKYLLERYPNSPEGKYIQQRVAKQKALQQNSLTNNQGASKPNTTSASKPNPEKAKASFHLQLGAYSSLANAQRFIKTFQNRPIPGLNLEVKSIDQGTKPGTYRVVSQKFLSKQAAEAFGTSFLTPKGISHYIISIN